MTKHSPPANSAPISSTPEPSPVAGSLGEEGFWRLIQGRRSIRRYTDRPVEPALIERILQAAIWAPSAHNRQPWRICVVMDSGQKARLSQAMADEWRGDLAQDNHSPAQIQARIDRSHARITGAGALILVCMSRADMDSYPDARRDTAEWVMTIQSAALATQNLLLAAHHYGLGACWMCAPLFVADVVRQTLDLPEDWEPQALITLGYPAETKEKERVPLAQRVLWR